MMLRTVLGDIDPALAGETDSHDHLFIADGQSARVNPSLRLDDYGRTLEELLRFRRAGGGLVVDAQPIGCGRMAALQARASRESGVHIIASTGFHRLHFYRPGHWIFTLPEDGLTELFVGELTEGMFACGDDGKPTGRTPAKAGVIKLAIANEPPQGRVLTLMRAAGRASLTTGAPILCHTEAGQFSGDLVKELTALGVPPSSIIVCHADRRANHALNHALARYGVWLEYDTIGRFKYHSDEEEAALLLAMAEAGFAGQLLLGLDSTAERHIAYGGQTGMDYLQRVFRPLLRRAGCSEALIHQWLTENPARAYAWKPTQSPR